MGQADSKPSVLGGHEQLIDRFVGPEAIPAHDQFWVDLLSLPYPLPKMKPADFDEATREACAMLGW